MVRCWLVLFGALGLLHVDFVRADHCEGSYGFHRFSQPYLIRPGLGYSGYAGPAYGRSFIYQVGSPNLFYNQDFYSPQLIQPVSYAPAFELQPNPLPKPSPVEPSKVPVTPSSPAARLKSLEHQARGDQRLRQQKWSDARAAYRSSVDAAPDRAEAHLRLGLSLVAIQRFESATHEFKRALFIDPLVPQMDKISKTIFGPDSQAVRMSIMSKLTDWVKDDYTNPERLFLMGVMLRFEGDARAQEFFEAAKRMKRSGDTSHIVAFMASGQPVNDVPQAPVAPLPKLNDKPVPISLPQAVVNAPAPHAVIPLPSTPVPMPDL